MQLMHILWVWGHNFYEAEFWIHAHALCGNAHKFRPHGANMFKTLQMTVISLVKGLSFDRDI